MKDNNITKILLAFVAGAAVGVAVGYFLNSDKKDELLSELKEGANNIKEGFEENFGKAKDIIDALKNPVAETDADIQA